jgi:cyclophilin family peptidyl-prolyl cis-trans isomerase
MLVCSVLIMLVLPSACMRAPEKLPPSLGSSSTAAPDSFYVEFETTKGNFVIKAHRAWSPHGVDRLFELTALHLYHDVPVFRMLPGKLVQFGLTGDSAVDAAWENRGIPDEPVLTGNMRGRVSFARAGAQTRSSQIFINLRNNSPRYDTANAQGVIGYPPIAEVVEGLSVLDSLEGKYGNAPSEYQDSISIRGIKWLDAKFPGLDRVVRTHLRIH